VRYQQLCDANGYEVVARFYDDGLSAYRSLKDRRGYGDLKPRSRIPTTNAARSSRVT
jgi:hypothetical protein